MSQDQRHAHDDSKSCQNDKCGCCGPIEMEFPDELLTPELKELKKTMSPEEFETLMKGLGA